MSTAKYSPLSDAFQEGTPSSSKLISKSFFSKRRPLKLLFVVSFLLFVYFLFVGYHHVRQHYIFAHNHQQISPKNLLLDDALLNLIQQLNSHSYNKIFIMDEYILSHVLNPVSKKSYKNFVELGIFAPFDDKFDLELLTICSQVKGISCDYQQFDIFELEYSHMQLLTHLIVSQNGQVCHISLFRKVGEDALFIRKLKSSEDLKKNFNLTSSLDEIYSEFPIECVGQDIYVPSNIDFFLKEKKNARFIDCNRESAKKFASSSSPAIQYNTKKSVSHMKSLMRRLNADVWLMSGTLLGWYRECKAIDHTTDADFATWSTYANTEFEDKLLQLSSSSLFKYPPSFRVFNIFGTFNLGYEVSFLLPNQFKSDLFFLYPEENNELSCVGHVIRQHLYYKYLYPSFKLCSSIFLGLKVNVPCDPETILSAEYGEWETPVVDDVYDYKSSPKNRGPPIPYPKDMPSPVRFF